VVVVWSINQVQFEKRKEGAGKVDLGEEDREGCALASGLAFGSERAWGQGRQHVPNVQQL